LKPVTGKIKPEFARKKIRQAASSPTTVTGANILIIVKKPQSRRSIALRFGVTTGRYWPQAANWRTIRNASKLGGIEKAAVRGT
jgi:hypothetical protein